MFSLKLIFGTFVVFSFSNAYANSKVGELFLVEHYSSAPGRGANRTFVNWIQEKSLGGMIFWNGNRDGFRKFQTMTNDYKTAAQAVGKSAPILSIDHEGQGVQRLRSSQGFTNLTRPSNLGRAVQKNNSFEVCSLHGEIMAKELSLAGINTSLGTIADTYDPNNRRIRGLLRPRSISTDPEIVSGCLKSIFDGIRNSNEKFLFITKHFPGLGAVNGNTDTGSRHSLSTSIEQANFNLLPFKNIIKYTERNFRFGLGLMSSNAIYPLYGSERPASESQAVLTGLLRKNLKFSGVLVSDGLWMGHYQNLSSFNFKVAISNMILSGMDMLMVRARDFERLYSFFYNFYNNEVSDEISEKLIALNGFSSKARLVRAFQQRVDESVRRIRRTKERLGVVIVSEGLKPSEQTQGLRRDYNNLLK